MSKVEITGVNTSELPKLSAKQCDELLLKVKQGDEEARDMLIKGNIRLVLSVVGRFRQSDQNPDDLFQVGCVGLLKAINNFDTSLDVRFSTYAVPMIIGEVRRFLRDKTGIKVSRSLRDTAYRALKAREELLVRTGNVSMPSLFEIAEELDTGVSEVACALDAVCEPVSLFEPIYSEGDDALLVCDQVADPKNSPDIWLDNLALREAVKCLPERERRVIDLRYYQGKTQTEISSIIGISQAQVSRLEKNAVSFLRDKII